MLHYGHIRLLERNPCLVVMKSISKSFGVPGQRLGEVSYLRVIPSQANYFLCEVTGNISAHDLTEQLLLRNNILIKDCNNKMGLTGKNYIRIAVRDHHDNDTLVDALKSLT